MSRLGREMRKKRVDLCMTIGDVSEKSGAHPSLIGKLERGYVPSKCPWFKDLERALKFPPRYLVNVHQHDLDDVFQYSVSELKFRRDMRIRLEEIQQDGRKRREDRANNRLARVA